MHLIHSYPGIFFYTLKIVWFYFSKMKCCWKTVNTDITIILIINRNYKEIKDEGSNTVKQFDYSSDE